MFNNNKYRILINNFQKYNSYHVARTLQDVIGGVVWVPTLKNVGARLTAETTRRVHHSSWEAALLHLW